MLEASYIETCFELNMGIGEARLSADEGLSKLLRPGCPNLIKCCVSPTTFHFLAYHFSLA